MKVLSIFKGCQRLQRQYRRKLVLQIYFLLRVTESKNAMDFIAKKGSIKLSNINYSYLIQNDHQRANQNDQKVELFNNLCLQIQGGTTNAIVGPSGFGKSTLFNMMYRIFDPQTGTVEIDGQDLKNLKIQGFRQNITIIPQNGILINDTILNNLRFANEHASLQKIYQVCKRCKIHDTIMSFPEGYEKRVGDLGGSLSGGERQRLLIARAMLKQSASIVLLDEATSSLDSQNEKDITQQLKSYWKGKTLIYCAHRQLVCICKASLIFNRLSSIIHVDKIFVMGDGKVLETGTHYQLLSDPNSRYTKMWNDYLQKKQSIKSQDLEQIARN